MAKPPEKYTDAVKLKTAAIINGAYYAAFEPLPFQSEHELPPNLRPLVVTDADAEGPPPFNPSERNIYGPGPGGAAVHEPGVVFQPLSGGQWVQRQARQAAVGMEAQGWAEQEAEAAGQLPVETEEALQAAHSKHIGLVKAQMALNQ